MNRISIFHTFNSMKFSKIQLVIFILLISVSNSLSAQKGIQWGSEIFKPSSSTSFKVIGNWPEGVLMQARTRSKLFSSGKTFIQRFDNFTLLPQFNKEINLETTKGSKTLEYAVLERVGDYPVLFASYFNSDKDKIELYGRKYNLEGEAIGKESKIADFPATRKSQLDALKFVQFQSAVSSLLKRIQFSHLYDQAYSV